MLADFYITSPNVTKDAMAAFFGREDTALAAAEQIKLKAIAEKNSMASLDLIGTASDDEAYASEAVRADLVHRRVDAVAACLREKGWQGKAVIQELVRNQAPTVDSRRLRRVTVKVSANQNRRDDEPVPEVPAPHQPAPVAFETARAQAQEYAAGAAKALDPSHDDFTRVCELARQVFTATVDLVALAASIAEIANFLGRISEWKPGVPASPKPGYRYMISGSSNLASTADRFDVAVISFGPAMESNNPEKQTFTFLHESAHAALDAHDVAYGYRRLFAVLDHDKAITNADSYAMFIVQAVRPGSRPRSKPPADDLSRLTPERATLAAKAIAEAETFLGLTAHDVDHTYRDAWNVLLGGKEWRGKYTDKLAAIRAAFPGELRPDLARPDDIVLTGMHNRLLAMRSRINGPLSCVPRAEGSVVVGLDATVQLPTAFFALPTGMDRVRALVVALAAVDPAVPETMRAGYADLVAASARYREER